VHLWQRADKVLVQLAEGLLQEDVVVEEPLRERWGNEEDDEILLREERQVDGFELFDEMLWFLQG
jgi:hypothetical protein